MKSRKPFICTATAILLSVASSGFALDLSRFQGFMSNPRQQEAKPAPKVQDMQVPAYSSAYGSTEADAYYVTSQPGQFVPLGSGDSKRDGEHYLLPPETRVPDELRPLLTERLTPRQGVAMAGGTGATLIPSPGVLEPGKTAVGVHIQTFQLFNVNDVKYTDQDYFDTNVSVAWGVSDGMEVSFDKPFSNQDRFDIAEPLYLNFKYQAPGNVTLGGSFTGDEGYHSVWVSAGVPVAWVGVGANFGADDFRFSYNGWEELKKARYGGYNYTYDKGEGYADPFFFMIGGAVPVNDHLRFIYDFNGDKFSLGFRFNYQNSFYLNAAYVSDGDYENLPGAIAHKQSDNFIFGGTIAF
ncbi:MAG: hypothetical protein A2W80_12345 [Candidatus Riflebacteria bacterium GWC2_50_8]|nr:MAG: hypothetical protein A2W80_12345 [Candidatus Riflebacteria bacterium GWC2_50_8]